MAEDCVILGLYELLQARRRWIRTRVRCDDDVDEVVQAAITGMIDSVRAGCEPRDLRAYVDGTLKHLLARYYGSAVAKRRETPLEFARQIRDAAPDPEAMALDQERRRMTVCALECLPAKDQALVRRCLRGDSRERIQAELELSGAAYRNRKHRAKAWLLRKLGRVA